MVQINSAPPRLAVLTEPTPDAPAAETPVASAETKPGPAVSDAPVKQKSLRERELAASQTRLNQTWLDNAGPHLSNTPQAGHADEMAEASTQLESSSAALPGHLGGPGPRLSNRTKNQLYLPDKRPSDNFNTQVHLPTEEIDSDSGVGSTQVSCRHLAFEYFNTGKKANFLSAVKNEAAIRDYFSGGMLRKSNNGIQQLAAAATDRNACVVTADCFVLCVREVASRLKERGAASADLLITSSNHAMAVSVQIKDRARVCINFYDPNITTNHFRIEAKGIDDLDALIQTSQPLAMYREAGCHAFSVLAKQDFFKPEQTEVFLRTTSKSTRTQVLASAINQALSRTDTALLMRLIATAAKENPKGGRPLKDILACTDGGGPGMFRALQDGLVKPASAYVGAVRGLVARGLLSSNDLCDLLKAEHGAGTRTASGLYLPMLHGHTTTVKNYLEHITDAYAAGQLNKAHVKELFSPHSAFNVRGISSVWQRHDAKTLEAIVQQLSKCHARGLLDRQDIKEMLKSQIPADAIGAGLNNQPLMTALSKQIGQLKATLKPLVEQGALQKPDIKEILATLGFVDESFKATLKNLFS
ncbi:MAG: hypothetical protein GAK37_01019 [Pseudomonas sp.]|nr:MAG: hypothetical protein GAK37_01019 [Pseudomonas sp.]